MDGSMPKGLTRCVRGHTHRDVLGRCPYCPDSADSVHLGVDYSKGEDVTAYTIMEGKEIKETGLVCKCCHKADMAVKLFECTNCEFKSILCVDCITIHIFNEHI